MYRLRFEKAHFTQVVVNRGIPQGMCNPELGGRLPVVLMKVINGTQDYRLHPNPDCYISRDLIRILRWYYGVKGTVILKVPYSLSPNSYRK